MYKLLALDIDDTTLTREGKLSDKNRRALTELEKRGVYVVIITGRSPKAAYPVFKTIPVNDLCVCFGGAVVRNMRTMETICADEIPPELVNETLEFAYQKGIVSQIYRGDDVVTEFKNPYTDRYIEYLNLNCVICPEIRCTLNTGIPKILCFSEENRLKENIKLFEEHFSGRLKVSASTKNFIELNNPNTDKGRGLEMLCDILNIDIKETVAIGDSLLDVPMIVMAGVGIAVENASDDVKRAADIISPDCDSDAVAWAAERYFSIRIS